jgi:uncharacterized membrane protein
MFIVLFSSPPHSHPGQKIETKFQAVDTTRPACRGNHLKGLVHIHACVLLQGGKQGDKKSLLVMCIRLSRVVWRPEVMGRALRKMKRETRVIL